MRFYQFVLLLLLCVPYTGNAQVRINEVAWMGTVSNANDEWIELYNSGSSAVDVTGWVLDDGVSLNVVLAGTVGAGEYAVLERTDDTTVEGTAFQIYTGALANSGRTLRLKHADASIEDEVVGGTNWENIEGNNTTKETAQRTSSGWVTGTATPGAINISTVSTTTEESDVEEESATTSTTESSTQTTTVSSSGGSAGGTSKTVVAKKKPLPNVLTLTVTLPKIAYVHQEVPFDVVPSGIGDTIIHSLSYTWNFGDTYTESSKKVTHSFDYPGEYVVVVVAKYGKHIAMVRHEITVLPISLEMSRTPTGDVVLKNTAKHEVVLDNFVVKGVNAFTFPEYTIIKGGKSLTVPAKRIGASASLVTLTDASHALIASTSGIIQPTFASDVSVPKATTTHSLVSSVSLPKTIPVSPHTTITSQKDTSEAVAPLIEQKEVIRIGTQVSSDPETGIWGTVFKKVGHFFSL